MFNPELKANVFMNLANANPRISEVAEAQEFTRDFENIALADSIIHDRIVFRKVAREGRAVVEENDKKAVQELSQLHEEVFSNGHEAEPAKEG